MEAGNVGLQQISERKEIITLYRRRFKIEKCFFDQKSNGFNIAKEEMIIKSSDLISNASTYLDDSEILQLKETIKFSKASGERPREFLSTSIKIGSAPKYLIALQVAIKVSD